MTAGAAALGSGIARRDSAADPVPLFVCGVARSGTTFAAYLLNRHPRIRCTYEAAIFQDGLRIYEQARNPHTPQGFQKLIERLAACDAGSQAHPWLAKSLRAHVAELYRRHCAQPRFATIVQSVFTLAWPNLTCFANKLIRTEFCPLLLREWPQARIVLLIRDPRAAYASQRRHLGLRLKYAAIYWNLHVQYALSCRDDGERFLLVRFEDLMEAPAAQLARILAFADHSDPAIAAEIVAQVPPRREALGKWRHELSPTQVRKLEEYCYDGMRALGYAPEWATGPRRITPARRLLEVARQYASRVPLSPHVWRRKRLVSRTWQMLRGVHG